MTDPKKDKKRDDVLRQMLKTPPDPRKAKSKKEKKALAALGPIVYFNEELTATEMRLLFSATSAFWSQFPRRSHKPLFADVSMLRQYESQAGQ